MTRRRSLNPDQLSQLFAMHVPRKHGSGYGALAKHFGVGESTVRDALQLRTAYAAAMKAKVM